MTENWVALLAEGVDRNFQMLEQHILYVVSPSSRRAWIEMCKTSSLPADQRVALLAEGVDRNFTAAFFSAEAEVALLAEGVDRNTSLPRVVSLIFVALLAEGVDRNDR